MNINLPVANNPLAFEIVLGSMIIVVAAMLAFFRWRKWI
jgi:Mg2+ and Co2+ transporter CorA